MPYLYIGCISIHTPRELNPLPWLAPGVGKDKCTASDRRAEKPFIDHYLARDGEPPTNALFILPVKASASLS